MIRPDYLVDGDVVAILSPASEVKGEYIAGARALLESEGLRVRVMPHAQGPACGSYAASDADRLADLEAALREPEVKAILCARGGYGCNHLLPRIDEHLVADNPKWLIGFSDITALHALWNRAGVLSLHAPMAKHLTEEGADDPCTRILFDILRGREGRYLLPESGVTAEVRPGMVSYSGAFHPGDIPGEGSGELRGGNVAVFNGLAATPYDIFRGEGEMVLFIEDISEAIYAVERMLRRIEMSGGFERVRGLVSGQFTEYRYPDRNFSDMEAMILSLLRERGLEGRFPVWTHFPAGHVKENVPLVIGAASTLRVNPSGNRLILS